MKILVKGIKTKINTNLHQLLEVISYGNHHILILKINSLKKIQREIELKIQFAISAKQNIPSGNAPSAIKNGFICWDVALSELLKSLADHFPIRRFIYPQRISK